MKSITTNVCIVGSGIAGATLAKELLDAGVTGVLVVESGAAVPMQERRRWLDEIMGGPDVFSSTFPEGYRSEGAFHYPVYGTSLGVRGGTLLHWDGHALRLRPEDFHLRENTGAGADWPFAYDVLEPFYAQAEGTLQVAGDAGDPDHPPRSGPYPLPAFPYQKADEPFLKALKRKGFGFQHMSISRNSAPINGQPQCMTFGSCHYCPIGARFTPDQLLDRLEKRPEFSIRLETLVTQVLFDTKSRATGVEAIDVKSGERFRIDAQHVVLCTGGIATPKLLLQSRGAGWDQGLGNSAGHVGKFLHNHIEVSSLGATSSAEDRFFTETAYDTAITRHFDDRANQPHGKFILFTRVMPASTAIPLQMAAGRSLSAIRSSLLGDYYRALWGSMELPAVASNSVSLGSEKDPHGLPTVTVQFSVSPLVREGIKRGNAMADDLLQEMGCETPGAIRRVFNREPELRAHHLGTARMARSANDGVVDENLRIHGSDNVYVCGSSVFPSGGAVNPSLTIAALAHRLGKHLAALASKH